MMILEIGFYSPVFDSETFAKIIARPAEFSAYSYE